MACDICGRGSCINSFHSLEEQELYSDVIDLFDKARDMREKVRREQDRASADLKGGE